MREEPLNGRPRKRMKSLTTIPVGEGPHSFEEIWDGSFKPIRAESILLLWTRFAITDARSRSIRAGRTDEVTDVTNCIALWRALFEDKNSGVWWGGDDSEMEPGRAHRHEAWKEGGRARLYFCEIEGSTRMGNFRTMSEQLDILRATFPSLYTRLGTGVPSLRQHRQSFPRFQRLTTKEYTELLLLNRDYTFAAYGNDIAVVSVTHQVATWSQHSAKLDTMIARGQIHTYSCIMHPDNLFKQGHVLWELLIESYGEAGNQIGECYDAISFHQGRFSNDGDRALVKSQDVLDTSHFETSDQQIPDLVTSLTNCPRIISIHERISMQEQTSEFIQALIKTFLKVDGYSPYV
nr:U3 small nucleolar RNA-associated protein 21 homolog [Ipomoea batatas]